eukprot:UN30046
MWNSLGILSAICVHGQKKEQRLEIAKAERYIQRQIDDEKRKRDNARKRVVFNRGMRERKRILQNIIQKRKNVKKKIKKHENIFGTNSRQSKKLAVKIRGKKGFDYHYVQDENYYDENEEYYYEDDDPYNEYYNYDEPYGYYSRDITFQQHPKNKKQQNKKSQNNRKNNNVNKKQNNEQIKKWQSRYNSNIEDNDLMLTIEESELLYAIENSKLDINGNIKSGGFKEDEYMSAEERKLLEDALLESEMMEAMKQSQQLSQEEMYFQGFEEEQNYKETEKEIEVFLRDKEKNDKGIDNNTEEFRLDADIMESNNELKNNNKLNKNDPVKIGNSFNINNDEKKTVKKKTAPVKITTWSCQQCTFLNHLEDPFCIMCNFG